MMKKFTTIIFVMLSLTVTCSLFSVWVLAQNQYTNRQGQRNPQSRQLPEGPEALVWSDDSVSHRTSEHARLPVRLVVAKNNAVYRPNLEDGKNEPRVKPKVIFWQLEPKNGKDGFYRIGTSKGKEIGWIREDYVVPWKTAYLLNPKPPQEGRENFKVFENVGDIDRKGAKPKFELKKDVNVSELFDSNVLVLDWVVLGKQAIGSKWDVKVAVPLNITTPDAITIIKTFSAELVFVIDVTGSMEPSIEAVTKVVEQISKHLKDHPRFQDHVRFGLVKFGDTDLNKKCCEIVCPLTDNIESFKKALKELTPDGGEDLPEEALCGLYEAIKNAGWKSNSLKHIFLVSDAVIKEKGQKWFDEEEKKEILIDGIEKPVDTIDKIIETAQGSFDNKQQRKMGKKTFWAILASNEKGVFDSLAQKQFKKLTQYGHQKNKRYKELNVKPDNDNSEKIIDEIYADFVGGIKDITDLDPNHRSNSPISEGIWDILSEITNPVEIGYASNQDSDGYPTANKRIMLLKSVTDNFVAALKKLADDLDKLEGNADDKEIIKQVIKIFVEAQTTGSRVQKEEIDETTIINDYLMYAFPLRLSILEESADSLSKKTIIARKNWTTQLRNILERMEKNTKNKWKPLELPEEYKKRIGIEEDDSYLFINPIDVLTP
ncbi:MAG: VWA domain-containing protein [Planctomycetaceae bacterium]|jgi:uncharacterized protein YegL|nr:VWA domain-containing protein [Planctomycetaceae bacterium]